MQRFVRGRKSHSGVRDAEPAAEHEVESAALSTNSTGPFGSTCARCALGLQTGL